MHDICTYHIQVRGRVKVDEINATGPFELRVEQTNKESTQFTIRTDQSGLIGLLRHLNGRGFVLLSVTREPAQARPPGEGGGKEYRPAKPGSGR